MLNADQSFTEEEAKRKDKEPVKEVNEENKEEDDPSDEEQKEQVSKQISNLRSIIGCTTSIRSFLEKNPPLTLKFIEAVATAFKMNVILHSLKVVRFA